MISYSLYVFPPRLQAHSYTPLLSEHSTHNGSSVVRADFPSAALGAVDNDHAPLTGSLQLIDVCVATSVRNVA